MDEQLLLAAEVAVQCLFRHASLSSDHIHRGSLVAVARENLERDIQDLRRLGGGGSGWTTSHCLGSMHFGARENFGRLEGSCQERQKRLNHTDRYYYFEGLKMTPRRLCHANIVRSSGLAVREEGDRCSHREGD